MQPKRPIIKQAQFETGSFAIRPPIAPLPAAPVEDHVAVIREHAAREAQLQAQALLTEAQAKAERLLAESQAQAEAFREGLLQEAQAQAEVLREAARSQGEAEGLAAGRAQGHEAVLQEAAAMLEGLEKGIAQALDERKSWLESQERDLLHLALMIAQKVLCLELAHSRDAAERMVAEALRHLTDKSQVRVRVHPMDLARVVAAKGRLALAVDGLKHLEVVADPKVGLAGCLVDTRTGVVDARLATQLAEIAANLLELAPGAEDAESLHPMVLAAITALGEGGHVLTSTQNHHHSSPIPKALAPAHGQAPLATSSQPASEAPMPNPSISDAESEQEDQAPEVQLQLQETGFEAKDEMALDEADERWSATPEGPELEPSAFDDVLETALGLGEELVDASSQPTQALADADEKEAKAAASPKAQAQDPSLRAAEALAWRLGQLKRGRGVSTLQEELQSQQQMGLETKDRALGELVHRLQEDPTLGIALDEILVHNPHAMEDAAALLAERLGQKPKGRTASGRTPSQSEHDEFKRALGDEAIDAIVGAAGVRPAGQDDFKVDEKSAAPLDLGRASELLAERLGKKSPQAKVRELKPEDSLARVDALDAALGDEAIDAILGAAHAHLPEPSLPKNDKDHLEQASDQLARLLGQPKKRRGRAWYDT